MQCQDPFLQIRFELRHIKTIYPRDSRFAVVYDNPSLQRLHRRVYELDLELIIDGRGRRFSSGFAVGFMGRRSDVLRSDGVDGVLVSLCFTVGDENKLNNFSVI